MGISRTVMTAAVAAGLAGLVGFAALAWEKAPSLGAAGSADSKERLGAARSQGALAAALDASSACKDLWKGAEIESPRQRLERLRAKALCVLSWRPSGGPSPVSMAWIETVLGPRERDAAGVWREALGAYAAGDPFATPLAAMMASSDLLMWRVAEIEAGEAGSAEAERLASEGMARTKETVKKALMAARGRDARRFLMSPGRGAAWRSARIEGEAALDVAWRARNPEGMSWALGSFKSTGRNAELSQVREISREWAREELKIIEASLPP